MTAYIKDSYVIAFPPGSAGRFVKYLLFNLLAGLKNELEVTTGVNSSHPSNRHTGHSFINANGTDIWNKFVFDIKPSTTGVRIVHSHTFPNFGLIKDRLGPNVKIIIITVDPDNLTEVIINDKVKNNYVLIAGKWPKPELEEEFYHTMMSVLEKEYKNYLGKPYPGMFVKDDIIKIGKNKTLDTMKYLIKKLTNSASGESSYYEEMIEKYVLFPNDIDYPKEQLLILPYSELSSKDESGKFIWLKKLEEFTNKQADTVTLAGYQDYIDGRNNLVKEYRI